MEGCPCPACSAGFTRGYIHYAAKAGETTGPRLLTLHNLSYIQRLMADLRDAIDRGELAHEPSPAFIGAVGALRRGYFVYFEMIALDLVDGGLPVVAPRPACTARPRPSSGAAPRR